MTWSATARLAATMLIVAGAMDSIPASAQGRAANGQFCRRGTPGCMADWSGPRGVRIIEEIEIPDEDGAAPYIEQQEDEAPVARHFRSSPSWSMGPGGRLIRPSKVVPDIDLTPSAAIGDPRGSTTTYPGLRSRVVIKGVEY